MTQFTAGLSVGVPRPAELVYPPSFPFRKDFWVFNCIWHSTLVFDVFTSYDDYSGPLANVLINGVNVGKIPPRFLSPPVSSRLVLAMQKVEGSSPFIRSENPRKSGVFVWRIGACVPNESQFAQSRSRGGVAAGRPLRTCRAAVGNDQRRRRGWRLLSTSRRISGATRSRSSSRGFERGMEAQFEAGGVLDVIGRERPYLTVRAAVDAFAASDGEA
jgi:hypothetical protein